MNKLKSLKLVFNNSIITPLIIAKIILKQKSNSYIEVSLITKIQFFLRGLKMLLLIKFGKVKKINVLFVTANHYEVEEDNIVYDKFITPFTQYLNDVKKSFKIARYSNDFKVPKQYFSSKNLTHLQESSLIYSKFNHEVNDFSHNSQNLEFIEHLKDLKLTKDLKIFDKSYINYFFSQKNFYKNYLRNAQIEHIVIVCFYDLKSFAIIRAANELNIPIIDLQHGVQGHGHFAYNFWPESIVRDSLLFPTHFWCWDEWSAGVIKSWFPNKENVITGYNIWMKERISYESKMYITFTTQPIENSIPLEIIEAIKDYSGRLKWCIRLHPHQLNEITKYKNLLEDHQILNLIEFDTATYKPLSDILSHTHIHITNYSSVILEAMWFGIPSIVTSELGVKLYKGQVPEKMLISAFSKQSILDTINKLETEWVFRKYNQMDYYNFEELANKFFRYNE